MKNKQMIFSFYFCGFCREDIDYEILKKAYALGNTHVEEGINIKITKDTIEKYLEIQPFKDEKIPKPLGDFIINNAKGIQLEDGVYYHYTEVIKLLKKYKNER